VRVATAELTERRFAEKDRAGGAQVCNGEAFGPRLVVAKQDRPQGRLHAFDVDLILHNNRDTVQRSDKAPVALEGSIERRRLIASAGIDGDERIDRRAVLVKSLDARQIELDQLARRQLATPEGRVHLIDCCFFDFEFLARWHLHLASPVTPAR
jgi:hypothetical protein